MTELWNRIRYRGWKAAAHVFLVALGILNLYPLIWMTSTSLKTESEAKGKKSLLIPQVKFLLTDLGREKIESGELKLSEAQQGALAELLREDKRWKKNFHVFRAYRLTVEEYAEKAGYLKDVGGDQELKRGAISKASEDLYQLHELGFIRWDRLQEENYQVVWSDMNFKLHTATSVVITLSVVFAAVLMSSMCGYAIARVKFPGKMVFLMVVIFAALNVVPGEAVMIPIFKTLQAFGLMQNLWGMTLWLIGVSLGNTILMAGFFLTLPKEVEEAAAMDGAGPFGTFFYVALPMATPIVMTVALFAFLGSWNNFLIPLITTQSEPNLQPLAVAVYSFKAANEQRWEQVNAAASLMVIPVIILFIVFQKYIVRAISAGAVKG